MISQSHEAEPPGAQSGAPASETKEYHLASLFVTRWVFRLAARLYAAGLLIVLVSAMLLLPSGEGKHLPEWLLFFGRFHPLVLHLPIGLFVLLPVLHLLQRFSPPGSLRPAVATVLWLCAGSAVAATVLGLLLSQEGGYGGDTLHLHRQFAFALSVFAILLLVCESESENPQPSGALLARRARQAYPVVLPLALACLGIAAHEGATLSHGATFLTEHLPPSWKAPVAATHPSTSPSGVVAGSTYATLIAPILQARCTSCHGAEKSKGGLRLNSLADIIAGGDSQREEHRPTVVPGSAEKSLLISALCLPTDDDAHMPPSGKPQLTPAEIATLRRWIDAGADATGVVAHSSPDLKIPQTPHS